MRIKFFLSLLICSIISIECFSQNKFLDILPVKNGKANFTKVLEVDGVSQKEFYNRAKYWLIDTEDLQSNMVYSDSIYDEIKSKGEINALWGPNDYPELYLSIGYTIKLNFRNNRYKYEFTNFIVKKSEVEMQIEIYKMENTKNKKYNTLFYKQIDEQIQILITSLEKAMKINIESLK